MNTSRRPILTCVFLSLIALTAFAADASFLGDEVFVPSVGRGGGASDSFWYTSVWFHNPGDSEAVVTVALLFRGQANPTPDEQIITVAAGSTMSFDDALEELFGLDGAVGALRVRSTQPIAVGARVFNQPGDTVRESQGQLMAGIPAGFAALPGQTVEIPGILQPADGSFRSNFGLVETTGATAHVRASLLDADGTELAADTIVLGPYEAYQRSLATFAPDAVVDSGILRIEAMGPHGTVLAFASAVANGIVSQDPTTLETTLDPELLGLAPEGGITAVEPGPGLAGGGSEGVVSLQVVAGDGIEVSSGGVSIAPGGVTADHIAPGQVVLGMKVGGDVITDVVSLEGGPGVNVESEGNTITISAAGCAGERHEIPITQALVSSTAGGWFGGGDQLTLPQAGRWRIGYRALVELKNTGFGTQSAPANVALYDATEQEILRQSMSVLGLQVDLNTSAYSTVSGEMVIDVDGPTTITMAVRSSRSDFSVTIQPHNVDLSPNLAAPDAASFFYGECVSLD